MDGGTEGNTDGEEELDTEVPEGPEQPTLYLPGGPCSGTWSSGLKYVQSNEP